LDLQAYISSGILESYALGATTPQENAEVEAMLMKYPELAVELSQIQQTLADYALLHEQTPPVDLKEKTRQAIFGAENAEIETITPKANFTVSKKSEPIKGEYFGRMSNWKMAASWALLALSVACNYYFFTKWKNTEGKLTIAEAQNTQMAANENILKANYESKIAVIDNQDFKKVNLKGTTDAPNAAASIYFNAKNNEVYLTSMAMPVLPEGKQYQLWAIINGKPVDAGMISNSDSLGKMKLSPNAVAFAISLENTGGSTTEAGPKGAVMVMGGV
jgi:anti-sigma-K factor RskA